MPYRDETGNNFKSGLFALGSSLLPKFKDVKTWGEIKNDIEFDIKNSKKPISIAKLARINNTEKHRVVWLVRKLINEKKVNKKMISGMPLLSKKMWLLVIISVVLVALNI